MKSLLDRASQAVSVTRVSRETKALVEKLRRGEEDHYLVMKNNEPAAVMLSVRRFEALIEELEDLRLLAVAQKRLKTLDRRKTIPHAGMVRRFE